LHLLLILDLSFVLVSILPPQIPLPANMVRLREIPRTATFAWSPGAASPLIATGTRAGAVDVDFSNKTCLELWDLSLERQDASEELQPVVKIDTDSG
jgi:protein transport protein SEC31